MEKSKIVFDLFGVIAAEPYFATNVVFPLLEGRIDYNLFKKRYILYCVGMISRAEFWHDVAAEDEIYRMEQRIYAATRPHDDILKLIKDVSSSYDLVVASEAPAEWANSILRSYGIIQDFSKLLFSSDLRATKPFKGFFDRVFTASENSTIYIDDTLENLRAAKQYGAQLVWYKGQNADAGVMLASSAAEVRELL